MFYPFICSAPGCGQRFTNEDHLAVHEHKHEMTLKFGPARGNSVTVADPKPTPTRFLKYCEEVGLFNELTSPMEHDFKIAAVDDIKKMPLDLSPLATPMIIHNKIEDHSAVAAHWDSPLCPIQNLQQGMTSPVSGTFPILFLLPNGQTMPVAIPATIASRVHIPTAIPLLTSLPPVPQPLQNSSPAIWSQQEQVPLV
ncbi:cyclic AMP-dependent transcription factor ATF-2-like isoform X2 [Oncorhynchus nerka]|uniref:cyclic AMP-dependent transcription factor ATF-2-like isoform X2 n=1 Tax=Oncorhynchus nerka TaxID=8023 RepID=UPI0031B8B28C